MVGLLRDKLIQDPRVRELAEFVDNRSLKFRTV